ncbi:hypothetical protein BD414DRAFT_14381 [Trametes punicea]|nr:hypothetical protein BD414DRAFT_14381 [Trametes punicea]
MQALPPLSSHSPSPPSPPSTNSDPHADQSRFSKVSFESSPSFPAATAPLLHDRSLSSYPSIAYRFTSFSSSPSLSAASDSPYIGPSRPLSLGDEVRLPPPLPSFLSVFTQHLTLAALSTRSLQTRKNGAQTSPRTTKKRTTIYTRQNPSHQVGRGGSSTTATSSPGAVSPTSEPSSSSLQASSPYCKSHPPSSLLASSLLLRAVPPVRRSPPPKRGFWQRPSIGFNDRCLFPPSYVPSVGGTRPSCCTTSNMLVLPAVPWSI